MYESDVENSHVEKAEKENALAYKFRAIGKKGAPDRLFLYPIENINHRLLVNKYVQFIEFKAQGKKLKHHQKEFHKEMLNRGYKVRVIDEKI